MLVSLLSTRAVRIAVHRWSRRTGLEWDWRELWFETNLWTPVSNRSPGLIGTNIIVCPVRGRTTRLWPSSLTRRCRTWRPRKRGTPCHLSARTPGVVGYPSPVRKRAAHPRYSLFTRLRFRASRRQAKERFALSLRNSSEPSFSEVTFIDFGPAGHLPAHYLAVQIQGPPLLEPKRAPAHRATRRRRLY
jgi:hypothetical protein